MNKDSITQILRKQIELIEPVFAAFLVSAKS